MSDRSSPKRGRTTRTAATPMHVTDRTSTPPTAPGPGSIADPDEEVSTGRPSNDRTALGIVELDVPQGRKFYPLDDRLSGRPNNNVGGIHIVVLSNKKLVKRPSHEMLMSAARAACNYATSGSGADPAKERIEGFPAGGES